MRRLNKMHVFSIVVVFVLLVGCLLWWPKNEKSYDFDEVPVQYYGKGYLVKVDGKYGFIGSDGKYLYEPEYEAILMLDNEQDYFALKEKADSQEGLFVNSGFEYPFGFGGTGSPYVSVIDSNADFVFNKNLLYSPDRSKEAPLYRNYGDEDVNRKGNYVIYDEEDAKDFETLNKDSHYYLFFRDKNKAYGPYYDESAYFKRDVLITEDKNVSDFYFPGINCIVNGLFYEKTDDGYVIHNHDDSKCTEQAFQSVQWLSIDSARVSDGKHCGIVNKDCDLVVWGDYEDISEPLDGKAFVKEDGSWKLREVNVEGSNHVVADDSSALDVKVRTAEDEFPDIEYKNIFDSLPSSYSVAGLAGMWSVSLDVDFDGNFEGSMYDKNYDEINEWKFSGSLKDAQKVGAYTYSTSVQSIKSQHFVMDRYGEDKKAVSDNDSIGLKKGDRLKIYCPGMLISKLPSHCVDYRLAEFERIPQGMFVIYSEDLQRAYIGKYDEVGV